MGCPVINHVLNTSISIHAVAKYGPLVNHLHTCMCRQNEQPDLGLDTSAMESNSWGQSKQYRVEARKLRIPVEGAPTLFIALFCVIAGNDVAPHLSQTGLLLCYCNAL